MSDPSPDTTSVTDRHWWQRSNDTFRPGITRVPLPLPADALRASNVYVLEDDHGLLMIDGGWALTEARETLQAAMASLGYDLRDVRRILVTHVHRDHYTQAIALRQDFGCEVSLGIDERGSIGLLNGSRKIYRPLQRERLRMHGADDELIDAAYPPSEPEFPDLVHYYEEPDHWLLPGSVIEYGNSTLEVIATPGHTQGHVVFRDPQLGLVFTGDHLLPHITPSLGHEVNRPPFPLRDYLDSLRVCLQLPDAQLAPGHGPVSASTHGRARELLLHHDERLAEMQAVALATPATAAHVAAQVGWTRRLTAFAAMSTFNQTLAILETIAHLDLLVLRDELASTVQDGRHLYHAPDTSSA